MVRVVSLQATAIRSTDYCPGSYLLGSFNSPLQSPRLEKHFGVSFVLIHFMIGELLSEVGGRVGHGLVLAWFKSYVLHLVFLDSSLESPGQEKHFGILFIPLRVVVHEIRLSVET